MFIHIYDPEYDALRFPIRAGRSRGSTQRWCTCATSLASRPKTRSLPPPCICEEQRPCSGVRSREHFLHEYTARHTHPGFSPESTVAAPLKFTPLR